MKGKLGKMGRNATKQITYKGKFLEIQIAHMLLLPFSLPNFMFVVKYSYIIHVVSTVMLAVIVVLRLWLR